MALMGRPAGPSRAMLPLAKSKSLATIDTRSIGAGQAGGIRGRRAIARPLGQLGRSRLEPARQEAGPHAGAAQAARTHARTPWRDQSMGLLAFDADLFAVPPRKPQPCIASLV
jgi:hypothetical protein